MTPKPMAWPDREWYEKYSRDDFSAYERAMKEAYAQRLVMAIEALRAASDEARAGYYDGPGLDRFVEIRGLAEEALALIGPLPEAG